MILSIEEDYRYVLLVASILAFHLIITGFIAGSKRSKVFNKEFMKKEFETEH